MDTELFDRVGGRSFFVSLVDDFYDQVATDPVLRPMYPDDLVAPREHLALFLMQVFGGPREYEARRGAPKLRLRHFPFRIDVQARDVWVTHMAAAVERSGADDESKAALLSYFENTATFLVNTGLTLRG